MGLLKKIFKPVSRVLDKIVPNEVKPFLPYAAAFAPMMLGPGSFMGSGIMQRALMSGGMNIGAQLAQEGNEGDINLLSAGLGALSGAMTTPEFGTKIDSLRGLGGAPGDAPVGIFGGNKYVDKGLMYLDKGADFMQAPGLTKYGIPAAQGTGDLMFAQAKRDQDEYDRMMEEEAEAEGASNASRAFAIRQSMEAYGFTEEEIEDAISAAGYKTGGRVGFDKGGAYMDVPYSLFVKAERAVENEEINPRTGDPYDNVDQYIEAYLKGYKEEDFKYKTGGAVGIMNAKRGLVDGPGGYAGDYVGSSDNETIEDEYDSYIKEIEIDEDTPMSFSSFKKMIESDYAKGGRVGLRFGGIGDAVENIEDEEIKESAKFAMNDMDIPIMDLVEEFEITFKRKPNSLEELKQFYRDRYDYKGPGDVKMQEEIKEKVVMEAKDGGLMDLGGKEMDMRGGGFIPIGKKERADDVPARLSKNEFVMTADAVRAAGGGSVNEGAKRMYETMNKLEARA